MTYAKAKILNMRSISSLEIHALSLSLQTQTMEQLRIMLYIIIGRGKYADHKKNRNKHQQNKLPEMRQ